MATASFSLRPLHRAFSFPNCPQLDRNSPFHPHLRYPSNGFPSIAIRASSTVALEPETISEQNQSAELFACPVCYEPLIRKGPSGLNLEAIYRSGFKCKKCNKSYSSKEMYLDLTVTAGLRNYSEDQPARTELFRSPLVSFLYERGWRQNFRQSGFPGPDEEFKMAQEHFKSVEGGVLIDISCGSGLFSRKFAKSGTYSGVVALDFSENMLRQCYDFIKRDAALLKSNLALVRADVSRLPFTSGSVDAVHAGAALHCWPSPSNAETISQQNQSGELFACPVCYEPLTRKGPLGLNLQAIYRSGFKCKKCNKTYSSKEIYLDLTVTAGLRDYSEDQPTRTELLRSPLVSFLYERGWRQNFSRGGFPGPDEEFKMAQGYFKSVEGGVLIDVSCGSGLFSRKFAKSGIYSGVVALDFSETMLRESYDFIKRDAALLSSNLALVRADISRLPFTSCSVDAVHAGAALHCWPSPSNAVAEITRILRSGGVFVGTTFLRYTRSTPGIIRPPRQRFLQNYNNLTEEEIEDLCTSCGLTNYSSKVQQSFIMFSAQKP